LIDLELEEQAKAYGSGVLCFFFYAAPVDYDGDIIARLRS
jgi:hypothetical protein